MFSKIIHQSNLPWNFISCCPIHDPQMACAPWHKSGGERYSLSSCPPPHRNRLAIITRHYFRNLSDTFMYSLKWLRKPTFLSWSTLTLVWSKVVGLDCGVPETRLHRSMQANATCQILREAVSTHRMFGESILDCLAAELLYITELFAWNQADTTNTKLQI